MQNITIGRYKPWPTPLPPNVEDTADHFDGWIEGVRDDGSTWIMFLDAHGSPQVFWADREPEDGDYPGGVVGDPIDLSRPEDMINTAG